MKLKLIDITPAKFACGGGVSSCPAVFKSPKATYVVVGTIYGDDAGDLKDRIGPGEIAIEISAELLETALGLAAKPPNP
jgi:hypothetical protein